MNSYRFFALAAGITSVMFVCAAASASAWDTSDGSFTKDSLKERPALGSSLTVASLDETDSGDTSTGGNSDPSSAGGDDGTGDGMDSPIDSGNLSGDTDDSLGGTGDSSSGDSSGGMGDDSL